MVILRQAVLSAGCGACTSRDRARLDVQGRKDLVVHVDI